MALSLQGYADHRKAHGLRGQSHVAVLHAINDGRLTEPAVMKVGKRWQIDPILADAQWAGNTEMRSLPTADADRQLSQLKKRQKAAKAIAEPAPAAAAVGDDTNLAGIPKIVVSKAVRAAYDAKLAELEYKKQVGSRVPIDDVKKEAFGLARRVREALMNIPDRVAAELAGETDPTKVHIRLSDELQLALTELSSDG